MYAHGSEILVEEGQVVEQGEPVLKVGSTGVSTGPHAHVEVRINGSFSNPKDFFGDEVITDNDIEDEDYDDYYEDYEDDEDDEYEDYDEDENEDDDEEDEYEEDEDYDYEEDEDTEDIDEEDEENDDKEVDRYGSIVYA